MSQMPENLQAGRLKCSFDRPYLSAVLWALHPVPAPGLGTMGVDKWWRLYYDPALQWSPEHIGTVLYHEVSHLLRRHHERAEAHADLDAQAWNCCADAEINDDLLNERCNFPVEPVTPKTLGQKDGLMAEEYYDALPKLKLKIQMPAPGKGAPGAGQCGSCADGQKREHEQEGPKSAGGTAQDGTVAPGISQAEAGLVERQVAEAVREQSKTRGDIPAWLRGWAEQILEPRVDWRKVMAAMIRRAISSTSGATDYTYSRPARRQRRDIVLPALRQPVPKVAVVLDTSGSVSDALIARALGEVNGVLKACGQREGVKAITCDADVKSARNVFKADQIEIVGRGGTDMRVGIEHALKDRPHVIIVLTDGETPWPDTPVRSVVIAGLLGGAPATPDWIKRVVIES